MTHHDSILFGAVLGVFFIVWMAVRFILYLKGRKNNTELWGTIFEGVTNKVIDLDPVKKPEVFIQKKATKSGQDIDGYLSDKP